MTLSSSSRLAPAIVRIAGISADFLADLILEGDTAAAQLPALREALLAVRRQVADALYSEVPHHTPDVRRRLLDLRRCCHNGRSVAQRLDDVLHLDFQVKDLSPFLKNLADLELRTAELESAYAAEYEARRRHEIEVLASPLPSSSLRRGLALASPSFSGDIESLSRAAAKRSRPNQRLVNTLVRYITRSALKLSPYSTLTPVALAEVDSATGQPVRFAPGSRTTVSNLRIKRYLLDQCCELLRRLPSVRPHLDVYLNSTVRRVGENQYRFLRPPQLQESEDASSLTYSRYEQINIRLKGALPAVLVSNPPQGSLGQLIRRLRVDLSYSESDDGALARAVDQLIEIGFLSLVLPVRSYDPHFEKALQSFLSALPPDPLLEEIHPLIDEIVRLEESFSIAADPAGTCVRVEQAVDELYQSLQKGVPAGLSARLQKNPEHNLYEDCFEVSLESAQGTVLQLDESSLRAALEAGNLAWQVASLRETRHELLLTLDAFMQEQFPGEESVPLLDLFERFRPLWEGYLSFLAERTTATFNPYNLSSVVDLEGVRLDLERRLREILVTTEEVDSFLLPEFRRVVHDIPRRWLNPLGPSLFLQPADSEASAWVVNRIFEGNGRMSSRYTTVMPESVRERYIQHYKLRSFLDIEEERAELLDLQYTKKNTANAHLPQTAKVLVMPGEVIDRQDAQAVELRDLFVRRRVNGSPRVVDSLGNRLIPSFLSPLASPFMPSILKFLDVFGYSVRGSHQLPNLATFSEGVVRSRRQMLGNLILNRAFWRFDKSLLPEPTLEPGEFFLQIQKWRTEAGLPLEVYVLERVYDVAFHGEITKPQYLRFESVTLVELLRELLLKRSESVTLVEAVPGAGQFPHDPELGHRAVEVIVEWLALTPSDQERSISPAGEFYQPAEPTPAETQKV